MNNTHWAKTKNGWVTEMSTLSCEGQNFMPLGESYLEAKQFPHNWSVFKDNEGDITHWEYRYPNGQIATILNVTINFSLFFP